MKVSTLSVFLVALISAPQSSLGRTIPVRRGDAIDPICGDADSSNPALGIGGDHLFSKRAPPPIVPKPVRGGAGGGAIDDLDLGDAAGGAGRAGVGAGGVGVGRPNIGGDVNPVVPAGGLDEFGAVPAVGVKRPLSSDGEGDVGQGNPKEPKVGPDSDDDSFAGSPSRAGGAGDDAPTVNTLPENGVLDVRTRGYTVETQPIAIGSQTLDFKVSNSAQFQVAKIRIDKDQKMIIADDLNFADDLTVNRARAWEVEMSIFTHGIKVDNTDANLFKASDLRTLDYPDVEEAGTVKVLDAVIANKGATGTTEPLSINRADPDFDAILNTKLGGSGQRIVDNTPIGKQIESFEVRPGDEEVLHGLTINYGPV